MKRYLAIEKGKVDKLFKKIMEYVVGETLFIDLSQEEATMLAVFMLAVEKTEPENIEKDSKVLKVEL